MPLLRNDETFEWSVEFSEDDSETLRLSHSSYLEFLPKILSEFDRIFVKAKEVSEFYFIWTLLGIRGMADAGWDAYASTLGMVDSIRSLYPNTDAVSGRHLGLWLYGHIMEASEPYEILANMIAISNGEEFNASRFGDLWRGKSPPSPGKKIERLREMASLIGLGDRFTVLETVWDREFRNAIFHADYAIFGSDVRIMQGWKTYEHDKVFSLINGALAYHEAMRILRNINISAYKEPKIISVSEGFNGGPGGKAMTIVKEDYGLVGLRAINGGIPWSIGRYTCQDRKFIEENPNDFVLPKEDGVNINEFT